MKSWRFLEEGDYSARSSRDLLLKKTGGERGVKTSQEHRTSWYRGKEKLSLSEKEERLGLAAIYGGEKKGIWRAAQSGYRKEVARKTLRLKRGRKE